jgi:NifU-like protein involved in Fe-S cluster formation
MADLDDIYTEKILELAAGIPHSGRLARPEASATARSKLCGSTITVDLRLENGRIAEFGQVVKACLLGQAAASIVGREVVGTTPEELKSVAGEMRRMLKEHGPPPSGRWGDLAILEPVRDYPHRHASTLLVFDATEAALDEIASRATGKAASANAF